MSSAHVWTGEMVAELEFNQLKQTSNRLRSLRENSLLPHERVAGDVPLEKAVTPHKIKLRDARLRKAECNRAAWAQLVSLTGSKGASVFIHSVGRALGRVSPFQKCEQYNLPVVENAIDADVVVAPDAGTIPELLHWELFRGGGLQCAPQFSIDNVGAAAEFKAAVSRGGKRYVWLSGRFQRERGAG